MRWPGHAPFRAQPESTSQIDRAKAREAPISYSYVPIGFVRGVKKHDAPEDVCTLLAKRLKVCFDVRKDNVGSRFWAE